MATDRKSPRHVASLENAYRVANRLAEATDQDTQVAATGEAGRPFIVEAANDRTAGVVARILAG